MPRRLSLLRLLTHSSVDVDASVRRDRLSRSYARRQGGRVLPASRKPRNKAHEACQGRVDDDSEQEDRQVPRRERESWDAPDPEGVGRRRGDLERRHRRHEPVSASRAGDLVLTLRRRPSTAGSRRRPVLSASRGRTSGLGRSGPAKWRHCLVQSAQATFVPRARHAGRRSGSRTDPVAGRTNSQIQEGGARSTLRRSTSRPRMPRAISLSSNAKRAAPEGT